MKGHFTYYNGSLDANKLNSLQVAVMYLRILLFIVFPTDNCVSSIVVSMSAGVGSHTGIKSPLGDVSSEEITCHVTMSDLYKWQRLI